MARNRNEELLKDLNKKVVKSQQQVSSIEKTSIDLRNEQRVFLSHLSSQYPRRFALSKYHLTNRIREDDKNRLAQVCSREEFLRLCGSLNEEYANLLYSKRILAELLESPEYTKEDAKPILNEKVLQEYEKLVRKGFSQVYTDPKNNSNQPGNDESGINEKIEAKRPKKNEFLDLKREINKLEEQKKIELNSETKLKFVKDMMANAVNNEHKDFYEKLGRGIPIEKNPHQVMDFEKPEANDPEAQKLIKNLKKDIANERQIKKLEKAIENPNQEEGDENIEINSVDDFDVDGFEESSEQEKLFVEKPKTVKKEKPEMQFVDVYGDSNQDTQHNFGGNNQKQHQGQDLGGHLESDFNNKIDKKPSSDILNDFDDDSNNLINDFDDQGDDFLDVLDSEASQKTKDKNAENNNFGDNFGDDDDGFLNDLDDKLNNNNSLEGIEDDLNDNGDNGGGTSEFNLDNLEEKNGGDFDFGADLDQALDGGTMEDDFGLDGLDQAMDEDDFENQLDHAVQETPTEENEQNLLDDFPLDNGTDSIFTGDGGFLEGSQAQGGQDDFRFSTAKPSKFGNSENSSEKKQSVVTFGNNQDFASAQKEDLIAINEEDGVIGAGDDGSFNLGDDFGDLGGGGDGSGFDDFPVDDDPFELDGDMDDW